MEKIRILLIGDNDAEDQILKNLSKSEKTSDYVVTLAESVKNGLERLLSESFEVILLDLACIGRKEAQEAFDVLRQRNEIIPVIVICECEEEGCALDFLRQGAQDYVYKSCLNQSQPLIKAIKSSIARCRMQNLLDKEIRERKKVENILRENQEQLSTMVKNLPGMFYRCRLDPEWTMLYVSEGGLMVTGYTPGELLNNYKISYNELILEEYRQPIWEKWQKNLAARLPFEEEYPIHTASGKTKWVWERGVGIYDNQGAIQYLEGYIEDITRRKETEQALIQEQYLTNMLMEGIPDHIYFKDLEGRFIRNNKSHAKSFGFDDPKQVIGKSDFDFFVKEFAQATFEDEQEIIRTGKPVSKEELAILEDNTKTWYMITKMPLLDMNGKIVGTFGISRDITKLKQLNEEILKAKEKAEENDKFKSAFLANISHEIRTPMNGILGFSELLKDPDLSPEEHNMYIQIIEQSGQRMLSIINDVVDISKIEAGQMDIHMEDTPVNQLLKDLRLFFLPNAKEKGIEILCSCDLSDAKSIIETDRTKLTQTLTNLIKNAMKFTMAGSISFGYVLRKNMLEFYVKDTGEGITPDQKAIIFERFKQGPQSRFKNKESAGLGLSISKAYIEMLGGSLWVESQPGEGSVFYFTLPYRIKKQASENPEEVRPEKQTKSLHILITEDDEHSMVYLRTILKGDNTRLYLAGNGQEAVKIVSEVPEIDVVLMDLKMPVMDGFEATRQIKKIRPSLPVIAQTAYAFSNDQEKAMAAGCDEFLAKPVRKELLFSTIQKLISDSADA